MCLLLFYVNPCPKPNEYFVVLVNVRDEYYGRPTKRAEFWSQHPTVIGGMDLEPGKEGGSWLAMNKNGRIGALLNVLQPNCDISPDKKGRGFLAVDYVTGDKDCFNYLNNICSEKDDYNGFLLVALDFSSNESPKLGFFTNMSASPVVLEPGVHAFGNSISPDEPWPKVCKAKEYFSKIITNHTSTSDKETLTQELFEMLQDHKCYSLDENMKQQGRSVSPHYLDKLSAICVCIPESNYGSRCHTIILIDGSYNVDFFERSRDEKLPADADESWLENHFSFKLSA